MKTVQRERRYVCGQTKQNAVYQEIEIYTVGTDQKSRQREKQKVPLFPFGVRTRNTGTAIMPNAPASGSSAC